MLSSRDDQRQHIDNTSRRECLSSVGPCDGAVDNATCNRSSRDGTVDNGNRNQPPSNHHVGRGDRVELHNILLELGLTGISVAGDGAAHRNGASTALRNATAAETQMQTPHSDEQAKPLPKKKPIMPVMVEAPCLDISVDDIPACVYPNPPSYSEAIASDAVPILSPVQHPATPVESPVTTASSQAQNSTLGAFFARCSPIRDEQPPPTPPETPTLRSTTPSATELSYDGGDSDSFSPHVVPSLHRKSESVVSRVKRALTMRKIKYNRQSYFTDEDHLLNHLITDSDDESSHDTVNMSWPGDEPGGSHS